MKRIVAAAAIICTTLSVHAAVTPLSDTEYSYSPLNTPKTYGDSGSESCGYETLPESYSGVSVACALHNAKNGRSCVAKKYCRNGKEVSVNECPDAYVYSTDDVTDVNKLSSQEYCVGYKHGVKSNYFFENPKNCSMMGITSEKYLKNNLTSKGDCGGYANVSSKNCLLENEDGETENLKVCLLSTPVGYPLCATGDSSYYPYAFKTCGEASNEDAIPCYSKCGDNKYCLGFTCNREILPTCSQLEEEQKAAGFFSSGLSNVRTESFNYQCRDGNAVKYMGFFCQNYMEKSDCESFGGTTGESCSVLLGAGGVKTVYQCSCGKAQTLAEFCQTEHAGEADCMDKYYGVGTACTLGSGMTPLNSGRAAAPMRAAPASSPVRYYAYARDAGTCDSINDALWEEKGEDEECPEKHDDFPVIASSCRQSDGTPIEICMYCGDYQADAQKAEDACRTVNATPAECSNGTKTVYVGCKCDNSRFKTAEEWCQTAAYKDVKSCEQMITSGGETCETRAQNAGGDLGENKVYYSQPQCKPEYSTREEWCAANPSKILPGHTCNDYVGEGDPCKFGASDEKDWKYIGYALKCPTSGGADRFVKNKEQDCILPGEDNGYATKCVKYNDAEKKYEKGGYICQCPPSYGNECSDPNKVRGGIRCDFDSREDGQTLYKYRDCELSCNSKFVSFSSEYTHNCPDFDNYIGTIRGGADNPKKCIAVNGLNRDSHYICGCPKEFKTLDTWCDDEFSNETERNTCKQSYTGTGTPCMLDVEEDSNGNPIKSLTKYASYARFCPTDRPLYYSEADCKFIEGEFEYRCIDTNAERVVCQCPLTWHSVEGENCSDITIEPEDDDTDEIVLSTEASGKTCDFDGTDKIKYEECVVKCSDVLSSDAIVKDNAYKYLTSDKGEPSQGTCVAEMGNGAVLGFSTIPEIPTAYCSANHTKMYPCYCPASFQECLAENNEVPVENAKVCSINGKTYYSECQMMACPAETAELAIVLKDTVVEALYGPAAVSSPCLDGTTEKLQVTCDSKTYNDSCDYPYTAPEGGSWCKHGEGTTLMKNGKPYWQSGACKIRKDLGECGKEIADLPTKTGLKIFVAATENECKSKYGPGISTQLCEYGEDQGYKRAYNCYYDSTKFKYTTANCGVRHDLTGNYIIIDGKKYWDQCNCASAYKHHKFNCGGLLSGNPCKQEISTALIERDATLGEAKDEGYVSDGTILPFYPYCQCSADYNQICDEDGSGRYKGVGTACNGKYTACECVPDPLPDNWTDNYYGCPGGKKPTGVWKDNGCGKKYYQCSVVECTWEYTEKCEAPLIPVGQSCQDNEGNIGGYKSCTCPAGYETCPMGQIGVGEPCNLKGVPHYKSCKTQEACTSLATETCTGSLQIGINPCLRDGITYYESCVCANGYSEVCGEGEVGVGTPCELNGKKYYKECTKPEQCPAEGNYVKSCDTNQESYSPCTVREADGKQVVKYLCRCPSNWKTAEQCSAEGAGVDETETCTVGNTTYYSKCMPSNACSPFQNKTYSVCTAAQIGEGPSCVSETEDEEGNITESVTKYASCKDSDNCLTNGFRFACSGYDTSALGESCVDSNGNKLYKSCPCPASYVSCTNPNASKGTKCVPLEENGTFGATKYSTCACDHSKYKYTCKPEDGNKGVVPPKTADFCTVDEKVNKPVTDEEGNTSTVEVIETVKYYKTCDCDSQYKYTCSDYIHGSVVPSYYEDDYCQINFTKFYKGCDCESIYKETVNSCKENPGQTVDTLGGSCTIQGRVYENVTYTEDGGITWDSIKEPGARYQSCKCKANYNLDCNGENAETENGHYDFTNIEACRLNGVAKYPQCKCKADYTKKCPKSGKNQGIKEQEATRCEEQIGTIDGGKKTTWKTTECDCEDAYGIKASQCDFPYYNQTSESYCDKDQEGKSENFKYITCKCDSVKYEETSYGADSENDEKKAEDYCKSRSMTLRDKKEWENEKYPLFCPQISTDNEGNQKSPVFYPRRGICCTSTGLEGYKLLYSDNYNDMPTLLESHSREELENQFTALCKHKYNADIKFDCSGKVYYKCINDTVTNGTTWYTKDECKALDKNEKSLLVTDGTSATITKSWFGDEHTVYSTCGCPSNYNKDSSCTTNQVNNLWSALTQGDGAPGPLCFNVGHRYKDGDDHGYAITQSSVSECDLLTNGESCTDKDGKLKYDWTKCACNANSYPTSKSPSGRTIDSIKYNNSSGTYHYRYCFDLQNHVFRNNGSGKGQGGGIQRGNTLESYRNCRQNGDKIKCYRG